jgi:aprataxin
MWRLVEFGVLSSHLSDIRKAEFNVGVVVQDIIAKGKRGTRKECLKYAERALAQRSSVLIDRCNIDKAQRSEFLQLAASCGVEAHGVVLNLPASLCIQRASKRVGHEGGVTGENAGSVINRFISTRQLPSLSEGFSRITFCRTDLDVEKVLQQYQELLPSKCLERGVFGDALTNNKGPLQLVPQKSIGQTHVAVIMDNKNGQFKRSTEMPQQAQVVDREDTEQMQEARSPCRSEQSNARDLASIVSADNNGSSTLAFPSISTSDFHFDHEQAPSVLVDAIEKFLINEDSKMRLVLVDLTYSRMMSLVCKKAKEKGLDSDRFLTFVGDITKLRSSNGPACKIIANAANW